MSDSFTLLRRRLAEKKQMTDLSCWRNRYVMFKPILELETNIKGRGHTGTQARSI